MKLVWIINTKSRNSLFGIVIGKFPKRALRAVLDWYDLHKEELLQDWQLAVNDQPLNKIEPLE